MSKLLLPLNIVALLLFLVLAFALPLNAQSQAKMRFEQLDRDGAIDVKSKNQRTTAPLTIAGSAISSLRTAANIGVAVTLANVALPLGAAMLKQPEKKKRS